MSVRISLKQPGLNCGPCGVRTCAQLASRLPTRPDWQERRIHLSKSGVVREEAEAGPAPTIGKPSAPVDSLRTDTLGRELDDGMSRGMVADHGRDSSAEAPRGSGKSSGRRLGFSSHGCAGP